jgi:hypothetical protein
MNRNQGISIHDVLNLTRIHANAIIFIKDDVPKEFKPWFSEIHIFFKLAYLVQLLELVQKIFTCCSWLSLLFEKMRMSST